MLMSSLNALVALKVLKCSLAMDIRHVPYETSMRWEQLILYFCFYLIVIATQVCKPFEFAANVCYVVLVFLVR